MRRLGLALLLASAVVAAEAARLDDSASPKRRLELRPRWAFDDGLHKSADRLNALAADASGVEVRLNTGAYVGKRGRIYLELPGFIPGLRAPSGLKLEWRARGPFRAGTTAPGERAVLYEGPITQATMSDTLDFTFLLDARQLTGPLRFDPVFEIELLP